MKKLKKIISAEQGSKQEAGMTSHEGLFQIQMILKYKDKQWDISADLSQYCDEQGVIPHSKFNRAATLCATLLHPRLYDLNVIRFDLV